MKYYILNGWGAPAAVWHPFIQKLAPSEAEIILPVGSAEPNAVISEAVCRLSAEKSSYAVIGWSLGALLLPDILPFLPKPPQFLVLTGAACRFVQGPENPDGWSFEALQRMTDNLQTDPTATLQGFTDKLLSRREKAQGFDEVLQQISWDCSDREALAAGLRFLSNRDCRVFFSQLSIPTLLLHGTADRICPYTAAENLFRLLPRAELIELGHAGHMPFFTRTVECMDRLQYFSERIRHENRQGKTAPALQPQRPAIR